MLANIAKTITNPVYLFKINFGSQYVYATSREMINYDGNDYLTKGARIRQIDGRRVVFELPNHDRSISALAFAGQIQGNDCAVYLHYEGDTIGRFTGLLDAPECSGDYNAVTITVVDAYALVSRWPYERLRKPTFNHLPAPGTIINLGSTNLVLERDGV
jgi:hypothetical protein